MENDSKKTIGAGFLGNALEFYDYTIYAFFAPILSVKFFPSDNILVSLMATYGVYAAGFIFRPIGGLLLGRIGDLYGRKKALEISILLMAIPTLCIGFLPTYAEIGIWAPILLTLIRILQGVSVGGEIVGSYVFLLEHASKNEAAYMTSWGTVGVLGGKWIGTLTAALLTLLVSATVLEGWAWRIPFIGGIVFAVIGYYIRNRVSETPTFKAIQRQNAMTQPLLEIFQANMPKILLGIGSLLVQTASLHLLFMYLPTYLKSILNLTYFESYASNLLALSLSMILIPFTGKLADKIGNYKVIFYGTIAFSAILYPAFLIFSMGSPLLVILAQSALAITFAFMHGPFPAFFMDLFPANVRYTSTAVSYNVGVAVFGGLSPVIATWLINQLQTPTAPALWLIFCSFISLGSMVLLKSKLDTLLTSS